MNLRAVRQAVSEFILRASILCVWASTVCSITGLPQRPIIGREPDDAYIDVGQSAEFRVSVVGPGTADPKFQWFENGVAIPGATNDTHRTPVQTAPAVKTYTATIHASGFVLNSRVAQLTVSLPGSGGLLAYWNLDEIYTNNVLDSAGSYHGAVSNAVRIAGKVGAGALEFNGTNAYVLIGGVGTPLQLTNSAYTIAWWMKFKGPPTARHQNIYAMDDGADYSGGYSAYVFHGSSDLTVVHADRASSGWFSLANLSAAWRHYAIVFQNGTQVLYEDGVPTRTRGGLGRIATDGDDPLILGAIKLVSGNFSNFFSGALDDFRIYDRALTSNEIAALPGLAPEIVVLLQPASRKAKAGEAVELSVQAEARRTTDPLKYQWEKNGQNIHGATNATLQVAAPSLGIVDGYRVLIGAADVLLYSDTATVEALPPDGELLVHLDFEPDGSGKIADRHGNAVQTIGSVPLVPGRVGGYAGHFSGQGCLTIPAGAGALALAGTPYTIAWWMKASPGKASQTAQIFTLGAPKTGTTGYGAYFEYPPFSSELHLTSEHRSANANIPFTRTVKEPDRWFHAAVVYDGRFRTIYVTPAWTGEAPSVAIETAAPAAASGLDNLLIGAETTTAFSQVGMIDDFRIYNYAMASDEIAALANVPVPAPTLMVRRQGTELVLSWSEFDTIRYRLEIATEMGGQWKAVSALVEPDDFLYSVRQALNGTERFYRLRSL